MMIKIQALLAAAALVVCSTGVALADQGLPTSKTGAREAALGTIFPAHFYQNSQVGTGGVGLRNKLVGSIELTGAFGARRAAFLYWAVITNGAPPAVVKTPSITRRAPTTSGAVNLNGVPVGSGTSPCWGGTAITVYKAAVPLTAITGNGTYEIKFKAGASGLNDGKDPWFSPITFPLLEGASLVVVTAGTNRIAIYDSGLSGTTFTGSQTYSLSLPVPTTSKGVRIDNIGADGQVGKSATASAGSAQETTTINGVKVAGPGSQYNDSDWNGAVAGPQTQLWDNTAHDLGTSITAGVTSLNVAINAPNDCLTPVVNAVSIR